MNIIALELSLLVSYFVNNTTATIFYSRNKTNMTVCDDKRFYVQLDFLSDFIYRGLGYSTSFANKQMFNISISRTTTSRLQSTIDQNRWIILFIRCLKI